MARGAPGVVTVQENATTQTKHITIPKNVLEDIALKAKDLVLFYKGTSGWVLTKITHKQKELIKEAHREGRNAVDALELVSN